MAAECCAKTLLPKLLRNMAAIPQGYENTTFVKACLKKAFEDLDKEVLRNQPLTSIRVQLEVVCTPEARHPRWLWRCSCSSRG